MEKDYKDLLNSQLDRLVRTNPGKKRWYQSLMRSSRAIGFPLTMEQVSFIRSKS